MPDAGAHGRVGSALVGGVRVRRGPGRHCGRALVAGEGRRTGNLGRFIGLGGHGGGERPRDGQEGQNAADKWGKGTVHK